MILISIKSDAAVVLINLTQYLFLSTAVSCDTPLEANSKLILPVPENKSKTLVLENSI